MSKRRVIQLIRSTHAWAGACLSFILIILGLSGTLLVFKEDYLRATMVEARIAIDPTPEQLGLIAEQSEAVFSNEQIRFLIFADQELGITKAYLASGERAYLDGSGAILDQWRGTNRLEEWIFDLHHKLLAGDVGKIVAGIAGLAAVLLVVTGLIALWPARRAVGTRIWPRTTKRRDVLASHRNIGLMAAFPILVVALTGAGMIFPDQAKAVLSVLGKSEIAEPDLPPLTSAGDIDWTMALSEAQAQFPGARITVASWPRAPDGPARIRLKQSGEWHPNGRTYVMIDPATSSVVGTENAQTKALDERTYNGLYPVHSARLGSGVPARAYDAIIALCGLAISLLGGLGLYAFLTHRIGAFKRST